MSNASMWWTVKETEASDYSIRDWDSANCQNDEDKLFSFHSSFHWELEQSMHHCLHSVDDDEIKSSWDHLAKAKIFNVFEEVSWQNHKRT